MNRHYIYYSISVLFLLCQGFDIHAIAQEQDAKEVPSKVVEASEEIKEVVRPIHPRAKEAADEVREGAKGNRVHMAHIGFMLTRPFEIHKRNKNGKPKLVEVIGTELPQKPIKVLYTPTC